MIYPHPQENFCNEKLLLGPLLDVKNWVCFNFEENKILPRIDIEKIGQQRVGTISCEMIKE